MPQAQRLKIVSPPGVSPWHPMTNPVDLKALGKFGEELGECTSATLRCIIQGIDEAEPVTGKVNRVWLEEEIADVMATMRKVIERFSLDQKFLEARAFDKYQKLTVWHGM